MRWRSASFLFAFVCVCLHEARAQAPAPSPPAPSPPAPAPSAASAPATGSPGESVRFRGLVMSVSAGAVSLELSRGLSLRLDLAPDAPMFFVSRIDPAELKVGARLRLRVKSGGQGSAAATAVEAMAMEDAPAGARAAAQTEAEGEILPELTMQGAFKAIERAGEDRMLAFVDRAAERRVALTSETTFWRLRRAGLEELKPGMSLSVVMRKDPGAPPKTHRAVFGQSIPGVDLPL